MEFLHNFTEKIGIFCPISENMKSWGQDLNCHNSKIGCHTKLLEIPGSGAKVSIHFDCLYGRFTKKKVGVVKKRITVETVEMY